MMEHLQHHDGASRRAGYEFGERYRRAVIELPEKILEETHVLKMPPA
jgi:hypothetical protein